MMKYYRKNDSKALKHYIGSLLSVILQEKNILKFLKLRDRIVFVKDSLFLQKLDSRRWSIYTRKKLFLEIHNLVLCMLLKCVDRLLL